MEHQFMTFLIDGELFALNILSVKEINESFDVTPVPLAPEHVIGLINLRGQIVTLMNLRTILGYSAREGMDGSLIILKTNQELSPIAQQLNLTTHNDAVGFLVDGIGNVITCAQDGIKPVPANAEKKLVESLTGVISSSDNLVGIVDLEKVMGNL